MLVQDRLEIAREGPVIGAVELDESRLRDVAGEVPAGADANDGRPDGGAPGSEQKFGPEDGAHLYRATPRARP